MAKANVAHQDQIGHFVLHCAGGLLHNPIICPGSGGNVIFPVRQTEENHRGDSEGMNFLRLLHRFIDREVEHARHGTNFLAYTFTRTNEHGVDEGLPTVKAEFREPGREAGRYGED